LLVCLIALLLFVHLVGCLRHVAITDYVVGGWFGHLYLYLVTRIVWIYLLDTFGCDLLFI